MEGEKKETLNKIGAETETVAELFSERLFDYSTDDDVPEEVQQLIRSIDNDLDTLRSATAAYAEEL